MIRTHTYRVLGPLEIVSPRSKTLIDRHKLLIVRVIPELSADEALGVIGNRIPMLGLALGSITMLRAGLEEYSSIRGIGCIRDDHNWNLGVEVP